MVRDMSNDRDGIAEQLFAMTTRMIRERSRELSLTALSTLATVERTGPRRLTDLALCEGITQPSMTALITQLEQLGLVERQADKRDGRVVLVAITRAGQKHVRTTRCNGASVFQRLMDQLDPDDVAALAAALPALRRLHELADDDLPVERRTT
jgi:DNA-binding MarR family transcriptional regulator